jgi:hypothetical protein
MQGSRQFRDFDEYLLPIRNFTSLKQNEALPLAVSSDCKQYLKDCLLFLEQQLEIVDHLAKAGKLPDVSITDAGIKNHAVKQLCANRSKRNDAAIMQPAAAYQDKPPVSFPTGIRWNPGKETKIPWGFFNRILLTKLGTFREDFTPTLNYHGCRLGISGTKPILRH